MAFQNNKPVRSVTWPGGATTGSTRIVAGADTPTELVSYGVEVAILFYVKDVPTNLEIGYFFIGLSNILDTGTTNVLLMGQVIYPVPGVPTSATAADVKTNFQIDMNDLGLGRTVFKDFPIEFRGSNTYICTDTFYRNIPDDGRQVVVAPFSGRVGVRGPEPTPVNGNSVAAAGGVQSFWNTIGANDFPLTEFYSPRLNAKIASIIRLIGQSSTSATNNTQAIITAFDQFLVATGGSVSMSALNAFWTFTGSMLLTTPQVTVTGTMRLGTGNQEIGQGTIGGSTTTSSTAAGVAAAETIVSTAASATYYAGRAYRIVVMGSVQAGTALANITLRIRKGSALAGALIHGSRTHCEAAATAYEAGTIGFFKVVGANQTTQFCLTTQASAGTAAHIVNGDPLGTRGFYIEDVGSSGNPAFGGAYTLI